MNSSSADHEWDERTSAPERASHDTGSVFDSLFERSVDAIWLFEVLENPQTLVLVDCNEAAVKLIGAESKKELLRMRPQDLSPEFQPDGSRSSDKTV